MVRHFAKSDGYDPRSVLEPYIPGGSEVSETDETDHTDPLLERELMLPVTIDNLPNQIQVLT